MIYPVVIFVVGFLMCLHGTRDTR